MDSTLKRDSEAMQRAEVAPSERLHQLHLNMLKAVDTLKLDRKKDDLDFNKKFAGQLAHLASEKTRLKDFKQEWKEYMEEMDPELAAALAMSMEGAEEAEPAAAKGGATMTGLSM